MYPLHQLITYLRLRVLTRIQEFKFDNFLMNSTVYKKTQSSFHFRARSVSADIDGIHKFPLLYNCKKVLSSLVKDVFQI